MAAVVESDQTHLRSPSMTKHVYENQKGILQLPARGLASLRFMARLTTIEFFAGGVVGNCSVELVCQVLVANWGWHGGGSSDGSWGPEVTIFLAVSFNWEVGEVVSCCADLGELGGSFIQAYQDM